MADEQFDQNFVWYEWSFVSPSDMPEDDLRVPDERETAGSTRAWAHDVQHGDRPWLT